MKNYNIKIIIEIIKMKKKIIIDRSAFVEKRL